MRRVRWGEEANRDERTYVLAKGLGSSGGEWKSSSQAEMGMCLPPCTGEAFRMVGREEEQPGKDGHVLTSSFPTAPFKKISHHPRVLQHPS